MSPVRNISVLIVSCCLSTIAQCQKPIDACFQSVDSLGFFLGSKVLLNYNEINSELACDLIEWDGTHWKKSLPGSDVDLPPPGCSKRAIWMGNVDWSPGGEAFMLKLDAPLRVSKTYSIAFTYAANGHNSYGHFSPWVYIMKGAYNDGTPDVWQRIYVGRMPEVGTDWKTDSITFTINDVRHDGCNWIMLWAKETSGIVLSNCEVKAMLTTDPGPKCFGDSLRLSVTQGFKYEYEWNTGDTTRTISVTQPGHYAVYINNHGCEKSDEVDVTFRDCELRLEMPNVFTPGNNDDKNRVFRPIDSNYIARGVITIFNRWGEKMITTDLYEGWDGRSQDNDASAGVYFYEATYVDELNIERKLRGVVSLIRY